MKTFDDGSKPNRYRPQPHRRTPWILGVAGLVVGAGITASVFTFAGTKGNDRSPDTGSPAAQQGGSAVQACAKLSPILDDIDTLVDPLRSNPDASFKDDALTDTTTRLGEITALAPADSDLVLNTRGVLTSLAMFNTWAQADADTTRAGLLTDAFANYDANRDVLATYCGLETS